MSALEQFTSLLAQPRRARREFPTRLAWSVQQPQPGPGLVKHTVRVRDVLFPTLTQEVSAPTDIGALEAGYVIENRAAVEGYLERNRVQGVLLEAEAPLNSTFGPKTIKLLRLLCDDEGFETLFCLLLVHGDLRQAQEALRRFDEGWWLTRGALFAGRLNFDFELR